MKSDWLTLLAAFVLAMVLWTSAAFGAVEVNPKVIGRYDTSGYAVDVAVSEKPQKYYRVRQ